MKIFFELILFFYQSDFIAHFLIVDLINFIHFNHD